ncbi:MAG: PAS domain S-box protein [Candidatus Pedobacter colombiensis]|uniref:histidine kinase n=1 Tax=Candidatus Pedobacter colombiensis TaxID=3121371 RepID=A0AAJ6B4S2_9SPHI|nr:PAS domain-containing protein [Pedobacter sp.]WEK17445.1 MAG: PAS domain S-box protein [Pedobacter sp.]
MSLLEGNLGYGQSNSKDELINVLSAYRRAVDNSVISSITDIKGNIIYVNQKFCEVSKYNAHELVGKNHNVINSGHHTKQFFKNMWKTIAQGEVWYGEIKNLAKDKSPYWVDSVIVPIKNNMGKPFQYLSLRTLISDRKANEERERDQNVKHMEEMLFKISHQMRQPVVQILGLSQLLDENRAENDDLKTIISYLKISALSLDQYIRELSVFVNKIKE